MAEQQQHPVTPPPELFAKCYEQADRSLQSGFSFKFVMSHAIRTAYDAGHIAARRPKPPSLAKRALHILGTYGDLSCAEHDTIRQALETLPND